MRQVSTGIVWLAIVIAACVLGWTWLGDDGSQAPSNLQTPSNPQQQDSGQQRVQGQELASVQDSDSSAESGNVIQRQGLDLECTIRLEDPDGAVVEGQVWLVERTARLDDQLKIGVAAFTSLWEKELLALDRTHQGQVAFPLPERIAEKRLIVVIAAPGFSPVAAFVPAGESNTKVVLQPVAPIRLKVVDVDGKPIANARCWLRPSKVGEHSPGASWLDRFEAACFGAEIETDAEGAALFPTCYPGASNTLQVFPGSNLAGKTLQRVEPGSEVVVECRAGFAAYGTVVDAENGLPIVGAKVLFSIQTQEGPSTVLSYTTSEDGRYRVEALPAGHSVLSVQARAPEFASSTHRIFRAEPAQLVEHDFLLLPAQSLELTLLTEWGQPIANTEAMLRQQRFGWETTLIRSDAAGVLKFPPIIPRAISLELLVFVESAFWVIPDDPIALDSEIILHGLSRVRKVELASDLPEGFEAAQWSWISHNSENQGEATWAFGEESPLLPCGAGYLVLHDKAGSKIESDLVLPAGELDTVSFAFKPAAIIFDWTGPEDAIVSLISRSGNWLVDEQPYPPGRVELEVWQGYFSLSVDTAETTRSWQSLRVDSSVVDLGSVAGADGGSVYGIVLGADGSPLGEVTVDLYSSDQAFSRSAITDLAGEFILSGVAPGSYMLYASGMNTYGAAFPESMQEVFLRPSQAYGPVEIVLSSAAGTNALSGRVEPASRGGSSAFLIDANGLSEQDLSADGRFRFAAPTSDARVGVACLRRGLVSFTSQFIPPNTTEVVLHAPAASHSVRLVDELGQPWHDLLIYAFADGILLGHFATPGVDGWFDLQVNAGQPLSLQFRTRGGRAVIKAFSEMQATETIVVRRNVSEIVLSVVDEKGSPMTMAAAMHFGVGDVYQADGYGRIHLPQADTGAPFLIEAPGHLGMWDDASATHELVLPTLIYGATLNLAEKFSAENTGRPATVARLQPMHVAEQALFTGHVDVPISGLTATLPGLPTGTLQIMLLDADGRTLTDELVDLVKDGQIIRIP